MVNLTQILNKESPEIAVFKTSSFDEMLEIIPAIRALRHGFPHGKITLIGLPGATTFARRFNNYFDDFIAFPGLPGLPEQPVDFKSLIDFMNRVQKEKFDLVIQMQGNGYLVNPFIRLFCARHYAGFYQPGNFIPDKRLFMVYPDNVPEVEKNLQLIKYLGIASQGSELEFPISKKEKLQFLRLKASYHLKSYVVIHPGGVNAGFRWPSEYFSQAGERLINAGLRVVVTAREEEFDLTSKVSQGMTAPVLNLTGQTNLGLFANLIESAKLVIANEGSVCRLATALNTPVIAVSRKADKQKVFSLINDFISQRLIKESPFVTTTRSHKNYSQLYLR